MMLSIAELCHLFIPPMQERGFGRVINVASMAGRISRAGGCNYGPTKAWVIAMSEELALTVRKDGVNVCALCPGFTHTEFHSRAGLQDMKDGMKPGKMPGRFFTTVRNLCFDVLRKRKRKPLVSLEEVAEPIALPESRLQQAEGEAVIKSEMNRLPENWREALLRKLEKNQTYAQIAAEMNVTHAQVRTWIFRARQQLKQRMTAFGRSCDHSFDQECRCRWHP